MRYFNAMVWEIISIVLTIWLMVTLAFLRMLGIYDIDDHRCEDCRDRCNVGPVFK